METPSYSQPKIAVSWGGRREGRGGGREKEEWELGVNGGMEWDREKIPRGQEGRGEGKELRMKGEGAIILTSSANLISDIASYSLE